MIERLSMIAEREHVTIDAEVLQHIARASEGCLRDAESLLEQVFALGGEKITLETASAVLPKTNIALCVSLVDTLSRGDLSATLKELNAFVDGGGSVRHATDELLDYVRTLLFVTLGDAPTTTYGATVDAALVDVAAHMTPHAVRRLLDGVLAARSRVSLTSLPQLPLEIAFAEFGDADIQKVKPSADPVVSPAKFSPHITSDDSPVQRDRAQHAEKASINNETKETPKIEEQQPVTFALEDLQNKWSRCCDYVADRNVALPLILRNAQPSAVEGNTVTLSFGYGFHADALKEQKNMRLVEDAIAEVMMQRVAIKTTIVATKESQEVASLAAAFGGSVV